MVRILIALGIVISGFGLYKGLASFKEPQKKRTRPPQVKPVRVQVVRLDEISPEIQALGRVKSEHPVELSAEVSGTAVASAFNFKNGASFHKGQVLLRIDDRRAQTGFKSAVSALMNALAGFLPEVKIDLPEVYDKWHGFFNKLSFEKLPDLPDYSNNKEKLFLSRFNIFSLYFAASNHSINLEKHILRAPFRGTVVQSAIRAGAMVRAGVPVGQIVRTDRQEIEVPLALADVKWVEKGKPVQIVIQETGDTAAGKILRISKALQGQSQTVNVYLSVKNTNRVILLDGMYASVSFKGRSLADGVVLPRQAVYGNREVYVIQGGRLKTRQVEIAKMGGGFAYIARGLADGDTAVSQSLQDAIPGMHVKPLM